MRKIIIAVIAVIMGLGLLAPPAHANKRDNALYVQLVRAEAPELKQVSRKQLIQTAKTTCRFLRAGGGILDAVAIGIDNGLRRNTAIAVVAGAIVFYCPEQEGNY